MQGPDLSVHRPDGVGNGPEVWGQRSVITATGQLAQNKTPQTRFESQGAQSISPPPSAAQLQSRALTVISE
jgi:hypothetical protein